MPAQIIEERVQGTTPVKGHHAQPRPGVWPRVRRTVAEMNYASRRMVERQATWIDGSQPGHRVNRGTG